MRLWWPLGVVSRRVEPPKKVKEGRRSEVCISKGKRFWDGYSMFLLFLISLASDVYFFSIVFKNVLVVARLLNT
jgi:hypothetical protein